MVRRKRHRLSTPQRRQRRNIHGNSVLFWDLILDLDQGHDPLWKGRVGGPGKAKQDKKQGNKDYLDTSRATYRGSHNKRECNNRRPRRLGSLDFHNHHHHPRLLARSTLQSSVKEPQRKGGAKTSRGRTNNKPVSPLLGLSCFLTAEAYDQSMHQRLNLLDNRLRCRLLSGHKILWWL